MSRSAAAGSSKNIKPNRPYHVVTQGRRRAGLCDAPPERFEAGDVLVVPHGDAYFLADPPDAQATYGLDEAVTFFHQMAAGELPSVVSEGGAGRNMRSSSAASSAVTYSRSTPCSQRCRR